VTWLLLIGVGVTLVGALFRSRVQAWESSLPAVELNGVKLLVAASVVAFIGAVVVLTLVRRRNGGKPDA
jgi:hypothetical protein